MLKIDRQNAIEQKLRIHGSVLISELSQELNCSEETIRRDFKEMEAHNKLHRIHGGAFLPDKYDKGVPIQLRETLLKSEKIRMAEKALTHIKPNDVIMLDSSTTCLQLAQAILNSGLMVTLITNSLQICKIYNDHPSNVKVVCLGGQLRTRTSSFVGYKTTDALCQNFADLSFLSCPFINFEHGLTDNNINEARVRQCMIEHSRKSYLLMDHTKFTGISDILFDGLNRIHMIITDKKVSDRWEEKCHNLSINIQYC